MSEFVHLHCHTEYSLLDGAIRLKDLCARAVAFGMPACAITDHGNMFGAAYFFTTCKEYGIKPIFGCEVYQYRDHTDRTEEARDKNSNNHLILLAQDRIGYHNLVRLVSHSHLDGFYYKPRVDKDMLRRYADGLICLSACLAGEIPRAVLAGDMDNARRLIHEYAAIFPNRFYLEIQSNGLPEQEKVNTGLLELAESERMPLVATNDCHYLEAGDADAQEVLLCIGTQTTMDDPKRLRFTTREYYYKSTDEMEKAFSHVPEAIANTMRIAASCNVELDMGRHYFPSYPLPEDSSLEGEFRRLAEEGLEKRLAAHPDGTMNKAAYHARLEHEINVINSMGFAGYFLIVQEFINWAKEHGIPVGPGRGSAAGSLVAWAMRITNIDPIPYNLLFERFLNSERVSLPDIDVDFCERRRGEVIQHMLDIYGADSVAQITTFGTLKAKAAVRDVGRALGMSLRDTDNLAKMIPDAHNMTIKRALEEVPDLKKLYDKDAATRKLLDTARALEGLTRHASTHAAGLVVSDKPMEEYLPLYRGKAGGKDDIFSGVPVTQFDGPMTEETGLVKFDFLGLKTLTVIQDTLENIRRQGEIPPDPDSLPLTDPAVYALYSNGDTDGIFQVESQGMRRYLSMLKPSCFEDLIAMLALYRPGPLESNMVAEFINRKHGRVPVIYPHPSLEACLKDTYGVIVYQEQVMQIAQIIAGYSLGGADLLRRAMGKKKTEAMAGERATFVAGAEKNNISRGKANEIFDLMEKFAAYGFNKSHSAAYALVSYITAYLKTHHKREFMAALLTSEMGTQDKLLKYIYACRDMGIDVLPPSVNLSQRDFTVHGGKVVFGLNGIKNVGESAVKSIVEAREDGGEFTTFLDLCLRVNLRAVTKRVLEALIKSGACDCFGASRAGLLASLDAVTAQAQKKRSSQQGSLLSFAQKSAAPPSGVGIDCPEASLPEMPEELKQKAEKEILGFFLTSHPLEIWKPEIRRLRLTTLEEARDMPGESKISCAVLVVSHKETSTKKDKKPMAILEVEDLTGHAEAIIFPAIYNNDKTRELLKTEQPMLLLKARIDRTTNAAARQDPDDENGEASQKFQLKVENVEALGDACRSSDIPVPIQIPAHRLGREDMLALRELLLQHHGPTKAEPFVILDGYRCHLKIDEELTVQAGPELDRALLLWAS